MQILVISNDVELINTVSCPIDVEDCITKVYNDSRDPLDIMSTVCLANPSILVIDDDFLKPETSHILTSIKKIMQKVAVIFVTSNTNIDLGREVSQLGVYYYALKPLENDAMIDALKSIINLKSKVQY
jgi:FixJ family two-component response regulator